MSAGELADYSCPFCGHARMARDNTPLPIFKCQKCGKRVHEAVADMADDLAILAERDDRAGAIARKWLETGGVAQ